MNDQDRDAYAVIVATLEGTGAFAAVRFGGEAEAVASLSTGQLPLILLTPGSWQEIDHVDPLVATRLVNYALTIYVQGSDTFERFQVAERLRGMIQEHLDGSDLGGGCLPALTRLRKGGPEPNPEAFETRYQIHGTFGYVVPDVRQRTSVS